MKIEDFHRMVGITNEEQRRAYYRVHQLATYSCLKCGEIIFDQTLGCPICNKENKHG